MFVEARVLDQATATWLAERERKCKFRGVLGCSYSKSTDFVGYEKEKKIQKYLS